MNQKDYLDRMAELAAERNAKGGVTAEEMVKEEVFKKTYIPQRLDEVSQTRTSWIHWCSIDLITLSCHHFFIY